MNFKTIRVRLTLWYLAILGLGLAALGVGSWFAMRSSMYQSVDQALDDRVKGIQKFMTEQIASLSLLEIRDEFREHSVLGPGGDLFQVSNAQGEWLYRSVPLENNDVPIRTPDQLTTAGIYEDLPVQNVPVRFASRRIVVRGEPYTVQVAAPLPEFVEALQRYSVILAFSAPLLLVVAGAGGYWISTRALRPVEEIRSTAESISIRNLSERLKVPESGDELQRLSETLNGMLQRLDDSVQRMSQFTADASHELRAPISVIRTTAELAVQGKRSDSERVEDMRQILAETERTTKLIDSLLLLARADSGQDGLERELMDLNLSVREAAGLARAAAKDKGIKINMVTSPEPMVVRGDAEALRRVAFVLLDNAIKYSVNSGEVGVTVFMDGPDAVCRVTDDGIGIAKEDETHIFDRFWRADKARSRGMGGAGLGLSIAQWLVGRHDGTIRVTSELGKGAAFEIRLPLQRLESLS